MRTACSHSSFWPVFHQRFGPFHRFPSKVQTYVRGSLACCSLIRLEEGGLKTNQSKKINPKSLLSQLQPLHPLPRHSLEPTTKCSGCDSMQHSSAVLLSVWEGGLEKKINPNLIHFTSFAALASLLHPCFPNSNPCILCQDTRLNPRPSVRWALLL